MHRGISKAVTRTSTLFAVLSILVLTAGPAMACDTPCCNGGTPWTYVNWSNTPYYAVQSNKGPAMALATDRCTKAWSQVSSQVTSVNGWWLNMQQSNSSPYVWSYRCSACIHGPAPYFVGDLVTKAPVNVGVAIDNVIGTTGGVVVDTDLVMALEGGDGTQPGMGPHYKIGYVVEDARLEATVDAVTGAVTLSDGQ